MLLRTKASDKMSRIGLVAGYGKLPLVFSKVAKAKGDTVIAFALKGTTERDLEKYVDRIHWFDWGDYKKALLLLATERIRKIIMLGTIKKELFFKEEDKLDDEAKKIVSAAKDKKDYAILNGVVKMLGTLGIEVIDATAYLKDLIPSKGVLTRRKPTEPELSDIEYGRKIGLDLSGFDIGQTVAVKDKTVIAVEAAEGTDETIKRAGLLSGGGFVTVKMARPDQDMRLDVPLVGFDTLKAILEAKGRVLALESDKTLLMDRPECIKLADENDISIVII